MKITLILFSIAFTVLVAGCATSGSWKDNLNPFSGEDSQVEEVPKNPIEQASGYFVRIGTLLIIGGIVYAVFTKAATGWGVNAALSGTIMILLSWLFSQPWLPWIGLITLILYAGYKIYNRLNSEVETEPLYK